MKKLSTLLFNAVDVYNRSRAERICSGKLA